MNPRARRIGIRLPPTGDRLLLTLPRPRDLAAGLAFVESRAAWVEARVAALPEPRPFRPGLLLPVGGRPLLLEGGGRAVAQREGDRLLAGGEGVLFAARVRRWLVAEARTLLGAETRALAGAHGLGVPAVRVGDPRSRWGSCARDGRIAYSWRLLLAPPDVRRSVVAHEVAHLAEPHHGPAFWQLATRLLGGSHDVARAWLRAHGPVLHAWGREPVRG